MLDGTRNGPLDRTVLDSLRDLQMDGAPDILTRVVDAFLVTSDPLITALREAAGSDDLKVMQNNAHSLKSSSANVGAMKLSEISKELELGCKNKTLADGSELVAGQLGIDVAESQGVEAGIPVPDADVMNLGRHHRLVGYPPRRLH